MAIPSKFQFPYANDFWFEWGSIVDGLTAELKSPTYVNDADVVATLYDGRSLTDPTGTPGTPVPGFDAITLDYVPNSKGLYRGPIEETFTPVIKSGYVVVVHAVKPQSNDAVGHWEIPAEVFRNH